LSLYDASYLELAERTSLPLATFDSALRKAGAALRIPALP
jgi:predicted nucleic acid-binding protein